MGSLGSAWEGGNDTRRRVEEQWLRRGRGMPRRWWARLVLLGSNGWWDEEVGEKKKRRARQEMTMPLSNVGSVVSRLSLCPDGVSQRCRSRVPQHTERSTLGGSGVDLQGGSKGPGLRSGAEIHYSGAVTPKTQWRVQLRLTRGEIVWHGRP